MIGVEYAALFSARDVQVTRPGSPESLLVSIGLVLLDDFVHTRRGHGVAIRLGSEVVGIVLCHDCAVTLMDSVRRIRNTPAQPTCGTSVSADRPRMSADGLRSVG